MNFKSLYKAVLLLCKDKEEVEVLRGFYSREEFSELIDAIEKKLEGLRVVGGGINERYSSGYGDEEGS